MSEQIREQVSAFLDGELPNSETELLLKRLTRDVDLRESFGRFALIGESMRGGSGGHLSQGFTGRVNRAIDGAPLVESTPRQRTPIRAWWRPLVGAAVAAGVATVAVLALQQREDTPVVVASTASVKEPLSYTVPAPLAQAPTALPAARLTNYVFAHSRYSSGLGQNNVLSSLLTESDDPDAAAAIADGPGPRTKDVHDGTP
jgi:negative regulator of sigma E activity